MAQPPRNGAATTQHPPAAETATAAAATMIATDRPLSFYDNLTSPSILANGGGTVGRIIQFPDIQFRFDESIPDRRSVHSSAKSDFFGLPPTSSQSAAILNPPPSTRATDGHRCSPPPPSGTPAGPAEHNHSSASPAHDASGGASMSSASPTSTASTVPAQMSPAAIVDSPRDSYATADPLASTSTPRSSRPSSTIKTITIKLPDTGVGPSEAVYMTTTVPQNFTKNTNTLIGRHKPTRNSLRHSRMLVANKTVPQRYPRGNSLNLRHVRLSKVLMVLQILVGLALSLIGLAITIWSPSTHTKDNPYWSGIVLILCGTMFLLLFEFKRGRHMSTKGTPVHQQQPSHQVQHRWRESCFHFLHVNALVVLVLTIFFTMLAFVYALIHTTNLSSTGLRCGPQFPFNVNTSSCVCTIDTTATKGTVTPVATTEPSYSVLGNGTNSSDDGVIRLEYRDFSCDEVRTIWYYVTITSTLLNSAGCLLAATFLVIYAIDCIRRPENDSPRLVASRPQPVGGDPAIVINGRTTGVTTTEDRHGVEDGSTMPLLQCLPTATHPPSSTTHEPNERANTSLRSYNSTTAENQLAEENTTLTTILSVDGDLGDTLPSS